MNSFKSHTTPLLKRYLTVNFIIVHIISISSCDLLKCNTLIILSFPENCFINTAFFTMFDEHNSNFQCCRSYRMPAATVVNTLVSNKWWHSVSAGCCAFSSVLFCLFWFGSLKFVTGLCKHPLFRDIWYPWAVQGQSATFEQKQKPLWGQFCNPYGSVPSQWQ